GSAQQRAVQPRRDAAAASRDHSGRPGGGAERPAQRADGGGGVQHYRGRCLRQQQRFGQASQRREIESVVDQRQRKRRSGSTRPHVGAKQPIVGQRSEEHTSE